MADFNRTIPKIVEWLDRHPDGCDATDVASALGLTYSHITGAMIVACEQGLVRWVHAPFGRANNRRVYFTPRHCPAVWGEDSRKPAQKKPAMNWKERAKARIEAKATQAQCAAGFASVGREVVVKAPPLVDRRFTPDRVEPFFSAMKPGSYIRTGSAIERAYAE